MTPYYYAGAPNIPSTRMPNNVRGNCAHKHKTYAAALACVMKDDRAVKRGNGPDAYSDRVVMIHDDQGRRVAHEDD